MKKLLSYFIPIMMLHVPLVAYAAPRDCRFITDARLIAEVEALRPKSKIMGFYKPGVHIESDCVRYCIYNFCGKTHVHVQANVRDQKNRILGTVSFKCVGLSSVKDAIKAFLSQKN